MRNGLIILVALLALSSSMSGAEAGPDGGLDPLAVQERCYGYSYGQKGFPQDFAQAHIWCQRSADLGLSSGQTLYAEIFYKGHGIQQDYAAAERWYRKAAEAGHPHAQIMMGVLYLKGHGVERDLSTGISWIQRAANQGDPDAQRLLDRLKNEREAD
jgi:TPR repeat protein